MFFYLHKEGKIGYKQLSAADLGLGTSHQTHIGLFDDVLTFLPNAAEIDDAMLIYEGTVFDNLPVFFDRIMNTDGTFRSPKIRSGDRHSGITTSIRKIAKDNGGLSLKWFLLWFGLEDEKPIFYLLNEKSLEINKLKTLGLDLMKESNIKGRLDSSSDAYIQILEFLESKVNKANTSSLKELEIVAQTNDVPKGKYRAYDIEKAKKAFEKIGRDGELKIKIYFDKLIDEKKILSYTWLNETKESFLPYDFEIKTLENKTIFLDVKSTSYGFDQKIIFSSQEILFADKNKDAYNIYRVYKTESNDCLKICENTTNLFSEIEKSIIKFLDSLSESVDVETIKLSVLPKSKELMFGDEIAL